MFEKKKKREVETNVYNEKVNNQNKMSWPDKTSYGDRLGRGACCLIKPYK